MKLTKKEFEKILKDKVVSECGVTLDVASAEQIYRCMAMIVRQIMSDRQKQFQAKTLGEGKKQVYYLCMEFLMGQPEDEPVQSGSGRGCQEGTGRRRHQSGQHF